MRIRICACLFVPAVMLTRCVFGASAQLYPLTVLSDNPSAYWQLDETNGTIAHDLIGGHDCFFTNVLLNATGYSAADAGTAAELPSTPAGKVLAGYLEAVNSGNKDKLEAFIKAHRPDRPDALERMLDLRWNTGGFELYSLEASQALNVQAVLREREGNGRYNRMSVTVSDGEPAVITEITLDVIPPPAGAPVPERLTQREAVAAWEAEIDKAASAGNFSGVWFVGQKRQDAHVGREGQGGPRERNR